jgi:ATP-dependent RNA helicase SUPV3L1/SUV3
LSELQNAETDLIDYNQQIVLFLKGKASGEAAKLGNELHVDLSEVLYEIREKQLEFLNELFLLDININKYLGKYKNDLIKVSLMRLIEKQNMIANRFQELMDQLVPEHPKDEYSETRKMKRKFIIHSGLTNTGKTYNAIQALKNAESGIYLAPLKLLALEIFQKLNYEEVPCNLATGEEIIEVPFARHTSCTIEKLKIENQYDVAVIDEAQMMSDPQRGAAWTRAILGVQAKEVHVCCSPDAVNLLIRLIKDCNDRIEILDYSRKVPLVMDNNEFLFPKDVKKGDALVVFSKKMVLRVGAILANKYKLSLLYGNMPPETRREQIRMFNNKETDIVITTDVIGMGVNLPVH